MKQVLTKQFFLLAACLLTGISCTKETDEGLSGNPVIPIRWGDSSP